MEQDRQGIEIERIGMHADLDGKKVLEVGCGNGRASAMLAPLVGSLVAIDSNEERLKKARSKVPGVDFRRGSGEALDFPNESFDRVIFTFSLHHLDGRKALGETHRVLRISGLAIVVEPAPAGDMHRLFSLFHEEDENIAAARDAVFNADLQFGGSDTFDIEYLFDDAEDVYNYFFGEYGMTRNTEYVEKMKTVLGSRGDDKPIRLAETVNIYTLIKI